MPGSESSVIVATGDPLIGHTIGAYVVKALLGDGGMAVVYLAEHQTIGRQMAVKVLKAEVASQGEWGQRFMAEAQVVAALKHRNIVEVFDFGVLPDGRQFLMMEYVQGEALDAYLAQHAPLPPATALDFADQILNALGEAHKKGIVHRDLKPGNVMLVREHNNEPLLKVLDFGLARQDAARFALEPGQQSAKASLLAGTPAYVAPEQAQGEVVDGRADLYALGVMLFEMLTGRLPFEASDDLSLVQMHVSAQPPALDSVAQNMPAGLSELVASLLAKSRDERPATADIARQAVHRLIKQLRAEATTVRAAPRPSAAKQHLPTEKFERPVVRSEAPTTDLNLAARPSPWPARLLIAGGLALGALVVWFAWPATPPPVQPVTTAPELPPEPEPEPKAPVEQPPPLVERPPPTPVPPVETPPLAPLADKPGRSVKPKAGVAEVAPPCEVSDHWRKGVLAQLADLGTMASKKSVEVGIWFEAEERRVSEQVRAATTPGECSAVESALARLQRDIERKP